MAVEHIGPNFITVTALLLVLFIPVYRKHEWLVVLHLVVLPLDVDIRVGHQFVLLVAENCSKTCIGAWLCPVPAEWQPRVWH